MAEGWLIDGESTWVWRFHRDDKSWVRDKKVFMDPGTTDAQRNPIAEGAEICP